MPTDKYTLAARNHDRVFVLGDATDLPSSKAGAVAHFQADVLIENVVRAIGETYQLTVVTPPIPRTIRFAEAPAHGRSILDTAASHKGADAYREVAAGMLAAQT